VLPVPIAEEEHLIRVPLLMEPQEHLVVDPDPDHESSLARPTTRSRDGVQAMGPNHDGVTVGVVHTPGEGRAPGLAGPHKGGEFLFPRENW